LISGTKNCAISVKKLQQKKNKETSVSGSISNQFPN
jgi:hypothetical protein